MINVIEACRLATTEKSEPYVKKITDIGHSFIIGTMSSSGEIADTSPCIVNKENGNVDVCFVPKYFNEIKKGKVISIPAEYNI